MSSLLEYVKNIYAAGDCSDFSIFVFDKNGSKIEKKVHKYIIRRSPYFYAMLNMNGTEAREGCVTIENISSDTMEHILKYLYTDELSAVTMEEAIEITSAASYLQLDGLKTMAVTQWKNLMLSKQPKDSFIAFRAFAEANLQVEPSNTDAEWHEIMDLVLTGLYACAINKIASESNAFMELFINYFGSTHPYLSMDLLAKWTLGENLSDTVLESRKQTAADLVKNIDAQELTLRTLTNLSKSEAFPSSYMMKQLHKKAEGKDTSVCGEVIYTVLTTKNRIFELEHETGYLLIHFKGFKEGVYQKDPQVWRHVHKPTNSEAEFSILSPLDKKTELLSWDVSTIAGIFSEKTKGTKLSDDKGIAACQIIIKCKNDQPPNATEVSNQLVQRYTHDFC